MFLLQKKKAYTWLKKAALFREFKVITSEVTLWKL